MTRKTRARSAAPWPGQVAQRFPWWMLAVLAAATFAAYSSSLGAGFVFDDRARIVGQQELGQASAIWDTVARPRMRSTVSLSLHLNHLISGIEPWSYHLFNLFIHMGAALVLFVLIRSVLSLPQLADEFAGRGDFLALAAALLWAVHPLNTQAVTYVIQRAESMMGLFFLLLLYCLSRTETASRRWPWYLAATLSLVFGLGSKAVMVAAIPVAFLFDLTFLTKSLPALLKKRVWWYGLLLLLVAGFVASILNARRVAQGETTVGLGLHVVTPWQYASSQPGVILHYIRLAVWPEPLCFDYAWTAAQSASEIVLSGAIVAGLLIASALLWRWQKWLSFLGLSFFLILGPTSSIMPIKDLAVEHRMYLPLACLVVIFVFCTQGLVGRLAQARRMSPVQLRKLAAILLGMAVLVLTAKTYLRNQDYESPVSIWMSTVATRPQNARAVHNLATELERQEEFDRAIDVTRDALKRTVAGKYPAWEHRVLLGELLTRAEQWDEAVKEFDGAIDELRSTGRTDAAWKDHLAKTYLSLGTVYDLQQNPAAAADVYRLGLELQPDNAMGHAMLGGVLVKQPKKINEAADAWRTAAELRPQWFEVRRDLGMLLVDLGRIAEGVKYLRTANKLEPEDVQVAMRLAWLLATADADSIRDGRFAVKLAEAGNRRLEDSSPEALDILAACYAEAGRFEEAVATVQRAIILARQSGEPVGDLLQRFQLYRSGRPFRS